MVPASASIRGPNSKAIKLYTWETGQGWGRWQGHLLFSPPSLLPSPSLSLSSSLLPSQALLDHKGPVLSWALGPVGRWILHKHVTAGATDTQKRPNTPESGGWGPPGGANTTPAPRPALPHHDGGRQGQRWPESIPEDALGPGHLGKEGRGGGQPP